MMNGYATVHMCAHMCVCVHACLRVCACMHVWCTYVQACIMHQTCNIASIGGGGFLLRQRLDKVHVTFLR